MCRAKGHQGFLQRGWVAGRRAEEQNRKVGWAVPGVLWKLAGLGGEFLSGVEEKLKLRGSWKGVWEAGIGEQLAGPP